MNILRRSRDLELGVLSVCSYRDVPFAEFRDGIAAILTSRRSPVNIVHRNQQR